MTIPQCPSCAGEGWITLKGKQPISYYIGRGLLKRVKTDVGERVVPTPKFFRHYTEEETHALYKMCWCNQEIVYLSQQAGRPLYWRDEVSGHAASKIRLLYQLYDQGQTGTVLEEDDANFLRAYMAQWVLGVQKMGRESFGDYQRLPWGKWLPQLARAETAEDFLQVDELLGEYALDPF